MFTYWLALTYPEHYIPFEPTVYCNLLYSESEKVNDCIIAWRSQDSDKAIEYYIELLRAIYGSRVYRKRPKVGDWSRVTNLLDLHAMVIAYYTQTNGCKNL